jgi:glycosyltransferase involved in cell wall biosynthesis
MKLLIMQHNLNERGGAERVILKIAQHYGAKIYTLGYERDATFEGFKSLDIEVFAKRGVFNGAMPRVIANGVHYGMNFLRLKLSEDYDVINAHMSPSEWARSRNERMLWYVHTPPREIFDPGIGAVRKRPVHERLAYDALSLVYRRIEDGIVRKIEGIATNSATTNRRLSKYLHRSGKVISPGVECKGFRNEGDGKYFLYHSRIDSMKRQEYAISAFEQFLKLSKDKSYRLILSGTLSRRYRSSAEYYDTLRAMRARNVAFRLNPSDGQVRSLYANCSALLFTPINEDFGIVPLEAMASSKAVIAVNEGGPSETVLQGRTGFLVNSPKEMADRMLFLAEHGSIAEEMGRQGRRRVESVYNWDNFFKGFDALARKVAKGKRS